MKQKILLVACILFALIMVNSGLNKFFNYMPAPEPSEEQMNIFGAWMTLKWIIPLVAVVEIVGGIFMAIPKTRALGALVILPVTVGIVLHHLTFDVATIGIGLMLLIINVWIMLENRTKYEPILN